MWGTLGTRLFPLTWWIIAFDGTTGDITFIERISRGCCINPLGSIIGLIWVFVDGLIGGAIFALIYTNIVIRRSARET